MLWDWVWGCLTLSKIYFECFAMILVIGYVVINDFVKWCFPLKGSCWWWMTLERKKRINSLPLLICLCVCAQWRIFVIGSFIRINTHFKEGRDKQGSEIMLKLKILMCRELGHDPILNGNTPFNIYSQVPMQPSFMLLIMKEERGFIKWGWMTYNR